MIESAVQCFLAGARSGDHFKFGIQLGTEAIKKSLLVVGQQQSDGARILRKRSCRRRADREWVVVHGY